MKRTVSAFLLATGLVLAAAPIASAKTDSGATVIYHHAPLAFADLQGHYAQTSVARLADIGLIDASGDAFQPNAAIDRSLFKQWLLAVTGANVQDTNATQPNVTRAEAAEWLAKAMPAVSQTGTVDNSFVDLQSMTADQKASVLQLEQEGVLAGVGADQFAPDAPLTRGAAAVLLDKALDVVLPSAQAASFAVTDQIDPIVLQAAVGNAQHDAGLYSTVVGNTRYVVVQAGDVPTSGYSVTIDSMQETAAGIFVHASLHAPAPGSMEAQHVENPAAFATLTDVTKPLYLYVQDSDLMTANPNP